MDEDFSLSSTASDVTEDPTAPRMIESAPTKLDSWLSITASAVTVLVEGFSIQASDSIELDADPSITESDAMELSI